MRRILHLFLLFLVGSLVTIPGQLKAEKNDGNAPACILPGRWQNPGDGSEIDGKRLLDEMAKRPVVMLGEAHTSAEHHRWQLHTLAGLYSRNSNMVLGFESFPSTLQPVLDRWTRGELSEKKFLELSRWNDVWRFDSDLYMPLFHFARMHRIPMRALNVERDLTRRISSDGWSSIPADQRRGIGDPLPPSKAYLESLKKVFGLHGDEDEKKEQAPKSSQADEKRFKSFVEVQTIWDRAMAEAIAGVRTAGGKPLVVAIVGRGHLEYGFGISHQLSDLGINNAAVLLPWDRGLSCEQLKTGDGLAVADAVFGVEEPPESEKSPPPMLGVQIENAEANGEKGVNVIKVVKDSVAASTGFKKGDFIVEAAGMKVTRTLELVTTIRRQSPGTWLPLIILREGNRLELIAKFPAYSTPLKHP